MIFCLRDFRSGQLSTLARPPFDGAFQRRRRPTPSQMNEMNEMNEPPKMHHRRHHLRQQKVSVYILRGALVESSTVGSEPARDCLRPSSKNIGLAQLASHRETGETDETGRDDRTQRRQLARQPTNNKLQLTGLKFSQKALSFVGPVLSGRRHSLPTDQLETLDQVCLLSRLRPASSHSY